MIEIDDIAQLRAQVGRELAVSDWLTMTQERIRQFADATDDHQWIHLDQDRAARESPYKTTIAHGFLSLSLISALVRNALSIGGQKLAVNYGLNRVRFVSAVPAGGRIRARVTPIERRGGRPRRQSGRVERRCRARGRREAMPGRRMAGSLLQRLT